MSQGSGFRVSGVGLSPAPCAAPVTQAPTFSPYLPLIPHTLAAAEKLVGEIDRQIRRSSGVRSVVRRQGRDGSVSHEAGADILSHAAVGGDILAYTESVSAARAIRSGACSPRVYGLGFACMRVTPCSYPTPLVLISTYRLTPTCVVGVGCGWMCVCAQTRGRSTLPTTRPPSRTHTHASLTWLSLTASACTKNLESPLLSDSTQEIH
jgi:hypothetical protein